MESAEGPVHTNSIDDKIVDVVYLEKRLHFYLPCQDDHIQDSIRSTNNFYEAQMLELVQRLATPSMLAVDAGANIGNHTVFFAGVCGMDVLAFEPESACYEILQKNIELNGLNQLVHARNAALGNQRGRGQSVVVNPANYGLSVFNEDPSGTVEQFALDEIEHEKPVGLLKIDVEGMELKVLQGAQRTIKQDRPIMFVEVTNAERLLEIRAFLKNLHYDLIEQFNWTPTWLFMPDEKRAEHDRMVCAQIAAMGNRLRSEFQQQQQATLKDWGRGLYRKLEQSLQNEDRLEKHLGQTGEAIAAIKAQGEGLSAISEQIDHLHAKQDGARAHTAVQLDNLGSQQQEMSARVTQRIDALETGQTRIEVSTRGALSALASNAEGLEALKSLQRDTASEMTTRFESIDENMRHGLEAHGERMAATEQAIEALKAGQAESASNLSAALQALQSAHNEHASSTWVRFELLETMGKDKAAETAAELRGIRAAQDEIVTTLSDRLESLAENQQESLHALQKTHQDHAASISASLQRIRETEDALVDIIDNRLDTIQESQRKIARELNQQIETMQAALETAQGSLETNAASTAERLITLETMQVETAVTITRRLEKLEESHKDSTELMVNSMGDLRSSQTESLAAYAQRMAAHELARREDALVLQYLKKQNQWIEERLARDTRKSQELLERLDKRLEVLENRARVDYERRLATERENWREKYRKLNLDREALQNSWDFLAGRALLDLVRHPLRGPVNLPIRCWRGLRRITRNVFKIGGAQQGKETPTPPPTIIKTNPVPGQAKAQAAAPEAPAPAAPTIKAPLTAPVPPAPAPVATAPVTPAEKPAAAPKPTPKTSTTVFDDRIGEAGWQNWEQHENASIKTKGVMKCTKGGGFPSAVRRQVPVKPGAHYRLSLTGQIEGRNLGAYWIVRDSGSTEGLNYYKDNQVPVAPLNGRFTAAEPASLCFRVFARTSRIDLFLVLTKANTGDQVTIERVKLEEIDAAEACQRPTLAPGEKIIASMASIPGREEILEDAVMSLVPQVDEVRVFLNGYTEIPKCLLNQPKIKVERSQIWGDDGDAGKFFWADDPTPGYRFTCDDDIVYPADYVSRMVDKLRLYQDKVLVGLHGIVLMQPLQDFYDPKRRHVAPCRSRNDRDFPCHVLGTGVLAWRAGTLQVSHKNFLYRNMADIWMAKLAHEQKIPLVCIDRPDNWVKPQPEAAETSIYAHSCEGKQGVMNTAEVQSHVIRNLHPLTLRPGSPGRKKLILAIKTYNRLEYVKDCIESFLRTRSEEYDWVLIVADDGSTDGTPEYLEKLVVPLEFHFIRNHRRYAVGQSNTIWDLSEKIGFDLGFQVDDDLIFNKPGWDRLYVEAVKRSGYEHLCYLNIEIFKKLRTRQDPLFKMPEMTVDPSGTCQTCIPVEQCMGALFTFTPKLIKAIGGADEKNFPIRGQWHIDLSIRATRAGFNDPHHFYDALGSNDYLLLQNDVKGDKYECSIPWNDDYKKTKDPEEMKRRYRVLADESRVLVPRTAPPPRERGKTLNSFFDRVYVLNLDRRPDRWERVQRDAARFGIELHRFPAVDGKTAPYHEQYQEYARQPLTQVPEAMRIQYSFDYYRKYPCDMSRVAYIENQLGRKAIASAGAWGYLMTMIHILQDAIKNDYEQILVLDDDVLFHKQFNELFAGILEQTPKDWKVLQLGTLQYNWDEKWMDWYSDNLYMCKGSSTASHAVGMHRSVLPLVLNLCLRFDMPYDEGPLHKPKALYPNQCLTFYPNLLIQEVSESDISNETGQQKVMSSEDNVYRWQLNDYVLDSLDPLACGNGNGANKTDNVINDNGNGKEAGIGSAAGQKTARLKDRTRIRKK